MFEGACQKSYLPFLEVLKDFPAIRIAVHTSGSLLEWMEANDTRYIDMLGELVQDGQVEILGGGFYEPILSMLPSDDALEQIDLMQTWAKKKLGARIRGLWLTERIWEPALPVLLSDAGIEFTICDTTHFQWAGIPTDSINGYFITEKQGKTVAVFPIDRNLRYTIPFHDPEETTALLNNTASEHPGRVVTYADDGEKFGIWPGTYDLVFEREWLRRFFTDLCQNEKTIQLTHFSEVIDTEPPNGRVMLPTASYLEMTQWALPAKAGYALEQLTKDIKQGPEWPRFEPFLRGGVWDNFLVKYPESNHLHKRMLRVSKKISAVNKKSSALTDAKLDLFRGQCNCAYWHGLFGGLYLNYLRDTISRHLLKAETAVDRIVDNGPHLACETVDFDGDGQKEVILENDHFNIVVAPSKGGAVSILDLRQYAHAISNVLARRPEAYHEAVRKLPQGEDTDSAVVSIHDIVAAKEDGLADYLIYDSHDRLCLQDHFLPKEVTPDQFRKMVNLPPNEFIGLKYQVEQAKIAKYRANALLAGTANVFCEGEPCPLSVTKEYRLFADKHDFEAQVTFKAGSKKILTRWCCESNLTLLTRDAEDRKLIVGSLQIPLNAPEAISLVESFELHDEWQKFIFKVSTDCPGEFWTFPVETVNQSEGGYERTYQGTSFCLLVPLDLEPNETKTITLRCTIIPEELS